MNTNLKEQLEKLISIHFDSENLLNCKIGPTGYVKVIKTNYQMKFQYNISNGMVSFLSNDEYCFTTNEMQIIIKIVIEKYNKIISELKTKEEQEKLERIKRNNDIRETLGLDPL